MKTSLAFRILQILGEIVAYALIALGTTIIFGGWWLGY